MRIWPLWWLLGEALELCEELAQLRVPYARLGQLYEVRQSLSSKRRLQQREENASSPLWPLSRCGAGAGPWRLNVDLEAPSTAPAAYRKSHRVVLIFNDSWPSKLPSIRFTGQLKSFYVKPANEEKSDHVHEASVKLLERLQEAKGPAPCMWRQTGGCSPTSEREPEKDKPCNETIATGASGFCDCDGDGVKSGEEMDCQSGASCPCAPRFTLKTLLEKLRLSLGAPLHPADSSAWKAAARAFAEDTRTVQRYATHGWKHPKLFKIGGLDLQEALDARMFNLLSNFSGSRDELKDRLLKSTVEEIVPGLVYSFPIFTLEFCELLMEEIRHFYGSKLPARRPNSMNNYGIILNEIGLEPMLFELQDRVIQPMASVLFPLEGSELESHHSFTIRYKGGEDTHLDVHTDDSDVTFNVNIFGNYTGAPLVFCGINGERDHRQFRRAYQHRLGWAVLHKGRHRHGAEDITAGERMNLVVWSYSYNYRHSKDGKKAHLREGSKPDARCVSYTHDRDFGQFREWPEGKKERFMGKGWCPPRGKEYQGFVPDVPDDQLPRRGGQQQ